MANPPPSSMTLSDNDRMMEMINGYWITQIVNAAATYALADHLAKGPAAAAEIAKMANTDPSATFRLLRACASLGLVSYDGECRFTATSLLNTLRTDNAQSLRDLAMLMAGPGNWLPWGRFVDCVKTGEPQAVAALGKMVFEYIAERPAESQTFTRAMKRAITFVTEEVARILDTHSATVIADIGGAGDSLLHAVLQANRAPSGIVFDLPNIAEIAKWATAEIGLERRVTSVGGDFFEAVPAARRVPSTVRFVPPLNWTIVPAWIVSVTPGSTSTFPTMFWTEVLLKIVLLVSGPDQFDSNTRSSSPFMSLGSRSSSQRCTTRRTWRARTSAPART